VTHRRWLLLPALLEVLLLAGCSTGDFTVRNDPPQTPAADNAGEVRRLQDLEAAGQVAPAAQSHESQLGPPLTVADVPSMQTYDPWERMNRFTYRFNARFDEGVFLPVANGYRRLPNPVRSGLHNFFSNLTEVVSTANYLLQLRPGPALRSLGRFALNSSLGIGGLFDVATEAHIPKARTGFGNTLARWGVHPGPYLVVPILGPYTLRDGFGFAADFGTAWAVNFPPVYQGTIGWVLTPVALIDTRSNTDFRYYGTGSVFEYDNVRFLYVRKTLIEDDAIRMWHRSSRPNPQAEAGK
jgi:phospholipid-binding lipoprotein MlaA